MSLEVSKECSKYAHVQISKALSDFNLAAHEEILSKVNDISMQMGIFRNKHSSKIQILYTELMNAIDSINTDDAMKKIIFAYSQKVADIGNDCLRLEQVKSLPQTQVLPSG